MKACLQYPSYGSGYSNYTGIELNYIKLIEPAK